MGDLVPFPGRPAEPRMYCVGCGADRTVPASASDPGPCRCGSTMRSSTGKPVGLEVVAAQGVTVTISGHSGFADVRGSGGTPG